MRKNIEQKTRDQILDATMCRTLRKRKVESRVLLEQIKWKCIYWIKNNTKKIIYIQGEGAYHRKHQRYEPKIIT